MDSIIDQDTATTATESSGKIPSYLLGADNHNIGNQNSSWFDPSTWGDRVGNSLKFGAVSIISGGAQLYNSGVAVGNWVGIGDGREESIKSIVSNFDSDLGAYYDKNREAADVVGFIASSFLPGLGGIKVLNAGQHALELGLASGKIGANLAGATGLLIPKTAMYIERAAQDINAGSAAFSAISQNGIKALASGAWQNVLEGAAFEIAVQATMFKSPVLDSQTTGDIIKNVLMGGALGGVVGGVFQGVGSYSKILGKVKQFEADTKFNSARALQQELNSPSLTVIRNAQDIESVVALPKPGMGASPEEVALYNTQVGQAEQKAIRIYNDMRTNVNMLAKGEDTSATNMVADSLKGMGSNDVLAGMLHADEIVRPGVMTAVEKEANALAKAGKPTDSSLQTNYVKLTGEGAGKVQDGEPLIKSISDSVGISKGGSLTDAVLSKVKEFKFKAGALWDAGAKSGVTAHTEAEARYLWASRLEKLPDELTIHQKDIPLLERAWKDGKLNIKLADNTGQVIQDGFSSREEMWKHIVETKEAVGNDLMLKRAFQGGEYDPLVAESIGKIVNTKVSRLDGSVLKAEADDYLAYQTANKDYKAYKESKQLPYDPVKDDVRFLPTYAKVSRKVSDMSDANGHVMDGATWIKSQEKIHQEAVDRVLAKATGDLYELIPVITEDQVWQANRGGAGAKIAAFASGAYGSLESIMQASGSISQKLKTAFRQTTADTLQGSLAALGRNQEAAIELATIDQKVTRSAAQWVRHTEEDGTEYLITKDAKASLTKEKDPVPFNELEESAIIAIENEETHGAIDAMISRTGNRTETYTELRAAQGKTDAKDSAIYRPTRPNPKDKPFFAFVKDDKVTGQGHTTMLFAASESKLQQLGNSAEQSGYKVLYKSDPEEFKKAYGEYEYSRTLNESYIDSDLKNKGIYSEFYTKTDPQKIVNDILQQHLREDDVLAMELMRAKNQKAFDFLEDQGKAYSRIESSKFGGSIARAEDTAKNPYLSYIKTALDISKAPESTMLYSFNKFLDESVSRGVGAIRDVFAAARTPYDTDNIDKILTKYGMNTGYRDAALDLLVNHTAPKGELTKFVRNANGIMSTLTLGLDPLNALVNAIGANVLRGTELSQLTDSIAKGDTKLAGKLAELTKIDVTGKGDLILSPGKLYLQAQKNFFEDGWKGDGVLAQRYREAGYINDDVLKFHSMMDDFALKGTETVPDLTSRIEQGYIKAKALADAGRKLTGNTWAETYNRFISADVIRQLTDAAETAGIMTRAESHSYINTFVNRVDGVTVASQRPLMFQGPLGNAVGLFQSYQFNMMQNLFRYTAEGSTKDAAMLIGLQGTFFGLNGLPAFQFMNQHVVGTASGNTKHTDLYDLTYGAAGKQMGDLLLYGLPSDLLRTNLYSRGDINPRNLTLIPTQIKDIPFVSGFSSVLSNIKDATGKIANGADVWSTFLQAVEYNGVSRPLAGLGITLEATGPEGKPYSTTKKGSILFSNDLVSLATLTRLSGGRPIDEAIVNDGVFRIHSYQQADHDKMKSLSEAVKASVIGGRTLDSNQMSNFAALYAKDGGKQEQFNKFIFNEMKSANNNEAQKIMQGLNNPFAKKVQVLMGGDGYSN